jgi:microcystin-dependent protein
MSTTTKWSLEKPTRGVLLWDVPINANFDKLDTILYKLRTSYAGTTQPTENADTGSTWYDTLNQIYKVRTATSWLELLTKTRADSLYATINHTHPITLATQFYWTAGTSPIHMAKIYFYNSTNLQIEFGTNPLTDKIIFKWAGTDGTYDIISVYSSKVVFNKPVEVPAASAASHAINLSTGDSRYLQKSGYTAADILTKLKTVDGVGSGLDADTVQGKKITEIVTPKSGTNIVNGLLITTNISAATVTNERFLLEIKGNIGTTGHPLTILGQGYISDPIANCKAIVTGPLPSELKAFCYNTYLCFYLPKTATNNYHFYSASVLSGLDTQAVSRVTSVTDVAYPSSGVTKLANYTLIKSWTADNDGVGSGLDADLLGGTQASAFLKTADLLTQLKTVDGSGSGLDACLLDGKHASDIGVPVGAIFMFPAQAIPNGYLELDGSAKSRTTYAALFALIGTTFGEGDGSTTFNLLDMRSEFPRGWDHGRGIDSGRVLGSLQLDSFKTHQHYMFANVDGDGLSVTNTQYAKVKDTNRSNHEEYDIIGTSTLATLGLTSMTGDTETRPRNKALVFCIKY